MESQTLPNNTNNQIFTILRVLIGVILLSSIDIEQLFNGVLAFGWQLFGKLLYFFKDGQLILVVKYYNVEL